MRRPLVVALVVLAVAALAFVGGRYFAPEGSVEADEAAPEGAVVEARGAFRSADALHHVEGDVALLRDGGGRLLHFSGYEATEGPDVYFHLGEPEAGGVRLAVEGTEDGRATKRGGFNVRLPDGVAPSGTESVVVWCDRFDVEFGRARLAP